MKKKFMEDGLSEKDAEAKAARIHNARDPDNPVGRGSDEKGKSMSDDMELSTLTAEERDKIPDSDFALPGRKYPIHDEAHARNALARGAQNESPENLAKIRAAVKRKFPNIDVGGEDSAKKMCLSLYGPGSPMSASASDTSAMPREIAGQPCEYFWKDLIHTGDYKHPTLGFSLDVDKQRMNRWAETGQQMIAAGVPIPINCDHSDSAYDTQGYIKGFRVQGSKLMGLCQFIGKDAALIAARNGVSVLVHPDFTDGEKRHWGEAIVHVALTPRPVVPDQEKFVKAASLFSARPDVLTFSLAEKPSKGDKAMADSMMPCSTATMGKLERHVKGLSELPIESKAEHIATHLDGVHGGLKRLSGMDDTNYDAHSAMSLIDSKLKAGDGTKRMSAVTAQKARTLLSLAPTVKEDELPDTIAEKAFSLAADLSAKTVELTKLTEQAKAKDEQILALSAIAPKMPDPQVLSQYEDNWSILRGHIVGKGLLTEPQMKQYESQYMDDKGHLLPMSLIKTKTGEPQIFAGAKFLLSLDGSGIKWGAGTIRDPNFQVVQIDADFAKDIPDARRDELLQAAGYSPAKK